MSDFPSRSLKASRMSPTEASAASVAADSYLTLHYRVSFDARESRASGAQASGADHPAADVAPSAPIADASPAGTAHDAPAGRADRSGPPDGDVVSTFGAQPATLQLGAGQLSPALEERLIGLSVGAHRVFTLAPDEAFGPRNPSLVQPVPRRLLEAESDRMDYSPGDVVEFNAPGGGRYAGVFKSFDDEYAIFDFNHPLAGQPVRFEVRIVGIL